MWVEQKKIGSVGKYSIHLVRSLEPLGTNLSPVESGWIMSYKELRYQKILLGIEEFSISIMS